MKLITLLRLMLTFIHDEELWDKFTDWMTDQGYKEEDINIILKNK